MKKYDAFKIKLEEEALKLRSELADIGVYDPARDHWEAVPVPTEGDTSDENDNADRFESYEERSALLKTLQHRLREVVHALKKLEMGVYGICEISDNPIEEDRLTANPAARTCKAHMNERLPELE